MKKNFENAHLFKNDRQRNRFKDWKKRTHTNLWNIKSNILIWNRKEYKKYNQIQKGKNLFTNYNYRHAFGNIFVKNFFKKTKMLIMNFCKNVNLKCINIFLHFHFKDLNSNFQFWERLIHINWTSVVRAAKIGTVPT